MEQEQDQAQSEEQESGSSGGSGGEGGGGTDALSKAVQRYRQVVASMPGIVPELVSGDTIEAIDASAEVARQAYADISRRIAEQYERSIPAGNPPRSAASAAYDALKPEAKIALGLRGK
jgi:hypothetical protein